MVGTVLDARRKLAKQLRNLQISYDPGINAVPKIYRSEVPKSNNWVLQIGEKYTAIPEHRALAGIKLLEEHANEVRIIRKQNRPPRVKGPELYSRTPYTDMQKELDEGMGVMGIAMGIVFAIGIAIVLYVNGRFNF